ncbi:MAG: diphthine--ammonia ligase [Anaerolineales bacterium]
MISSPNSSMADRPFFCSWSGGKDSSLALHYAIRNGGSPRYLFSMMSEDGHGSRSHGLPRSLLEEQARLLGIPIVFGYASWTEYEKVFSAALEEFRAEGITDGVLGDIDMQDHRDWCLRVCGAKDIRARHPLWQRPRRELLEEFVALGFKATIVVTQAEKMGPEWLGRTIDAHAITGLERLGVDPSGETGEYHTVVTESPIFQTRMALSIGEPVLHDGYWFLSVSATPPETPGRE